MERDQGRNGEHGVAVFGVIYAMVGILFSGVLFIYALAPKQKAGANTADKNVPLEGGVDGTGDPFSQDRSVDMGTAGLTCVFLPGLPRGRTPALDKRVAWRWSDALNNLKSKGIAVTVNWGFRTTCQQVNVRGTYGVKARPGSSPHEAGIAVDINGMCGSRSGTSCTGISGYGQRVLPILRSHGFQWLGLGDPPHFHMFLGEIGEPSRPALIQKNQADFKRGNPSGCRGPECGGL